MWNDNYTVLLDGETWPFSNWTDTTNTHIYMNYTHSEREVVIVPEFPSSAFLSLFMILTVLVIVYSKKRFARIKNKRYK